MSESRSRYGEGYPPSYERIDEYQLEQRLRAIPPDRRRPLVERVLLRLSDPAADIITTDEATG
jgi:hypothetical protein